MHVKWTRPKTVTYVRVCGCGRNDDNKWIGIIILLGREWKRKKPFDLNASDGENDGITCNIINININIIIIIMFRYAAVRVASCVSTTAAVWCI